MPMPMPLPLASHPASTLGSLSITRNFSLTGKDNYFIVIMRMKDELGERYKHIEIILRLSKQTRLDLKSDSTKSD